MSRAEELAERYRVRAVALRKAHAFDPETGAAETQSLTAFSMGYLMGAGMPEAAATVSHLYRRAYPGSYLPAVVVEELP